MAFDAKAFFLHYRMQIHNFFLQHYWLSRALGAFFLVFITCVAYAPTFWAPFVFDDNPVIVRFVQSYRDHNLFDLVWSSGRWVCYFLNVAIGRTLGIHIIPFRILALGTHLLIGLLLFLTFKRVCEHSREGSLFQKRSILFPAVIAALYLLHPAHSQTVGYITQMELEGFALLSIVLAFYFITLYATTTTWWAKGSSAAALIGLMFFATGTKEIIIILPILALLFDWFFLAQGEYKKILSRLFLYGVMTLALVFMFKQGAHGVTLKQAVTGSFEVASNRGNQLAGYGNKVTAYRYAITQWRVIIHYLRIYFLPYDFSFDYNFTLAQSPFEPAIFMSFLFLLALACLSIVAFIKNKVSIFAFAVWWFFIALAPRSTLIPAWELAADYKAYLPGLGIIILMGYAAVYFYENVHTFAFMRRTSHYAALCVVIFFSGRVFQESLLRTDLISFWHNSIHHSPNKARLWNNYGAALVEGKRFAEGVAAWETSVALDDHYAEPLVNLGIYYQGIGKKEKAWEAYNKARPMIDEPHYTMYNNIGTLYLEEKKYEDAERAFRIALHLRGDYGEAYANLGIIHAELGKPEAAINDFYQSMKLGCCAPSIKYRCAEALLVCDREKEALDLLAAPEKSKFAFFATLGQQLYESKQPTRALIYLNQCLKYEADNSLILYNKGLCCLALEKWDDATLCFKKVNDTEKFPFAQLHCVKSLASCGKNSEARVLADKIMGEPTVPPTIKKELYTLAQNFKL